jgi:hypothetical protein
MQGVSKILDCNCSLIAFKRVAVFPAASRWVPFSPHYSKRITTNWASEKGDLRDKFQLNLQLFDQFE